MQERFIRTRYEVERVAHPRSCFRRRAYVFERLGRPLLATLFSTITTMALSTRSLGIEPLMDISSRRILLSAINPWNSREVGIFIRAKSCWLPEQCGRRMSLVAALFSDGNTGPFHVPGAIGRVQTVLSSVR